MAGRHAPLFPFEQQKVFVGQALAGNRDAAGKLVACYEYLIKWLASSQINEQDREDLASDLRIHFLQKLVPHMQKLDIRGYAGYVRVCLTHARISYWESNNNHRKEEPTDILEIIAEETAEPGVAREIVWTMLENHPAIVWNMRFGHSNVIPVFAKKLDVTPKEFRLKLVEAMRKANPTKERMEEFFGKLGGLWLLTPQQLRHVQKKASSRQKKALDLYLQGESVKDIGKTLSRGAFYLLERLLHGINSGFHPITISDYFRNLERMELIRAIQLATPIELGILQICLRGNPLTENEPGNAKQDRSKNFDALRRLKDRLNKTKAENKPLLSNPEYPNKKSKQHKYVPKG